MKPPQPTELQIQVSFRNRVRIGAPAVSVVAIPNAARRGPKAVRQARAEGMAAGFPDVMCIWSGGICFIEFKRPGGRLTDNQIEWLIRLKQRGFRAKVCRSADEAMDFLRECDAPVMEARRAA